MKEHYGIRIPESSLRKITQSHAKKMREKDIKRKIPQEKGVNRVISGIDGTMIPIVEVEEIEAEQTNVRPVK